ncbi:MAG: hypothetical protein ACYDAQ_06015, partial [Mycobacteriales bacterium]
GPRSRHHRRPEGEHANHQRHQTPAGAPARSAPTARGSYQGAGHCIPEPWIVPLARNARTDRQIVGVARTRLAKVPATGAAKPGM